MDENNSNDLAAQFLKLYDAGLALQRFAEGGDVQNAPDDAMTPEIEFLLNSLAQQRRPIPQMPAPYAPQQPISPLAAMRR